MKKDDQGTKEGRSVSHVFANIEKFIAGKRSDVKPPTGLVNLGMH
jgi:hypothetical protein